MIMLAALAMMASSLLSATADTETIETSPTARQKLRRLADALPPEVAFVQRDDGQRHKENPLAVARKQQRRGRLRNLQQEYEGTVVSSPTGRVKGLVLLVTFPGDEDKLKAPVEYIDEVFNGVGTSEANPAGSISKWLAYQSLNRLQVEYVVQDWALAPQPEKFYAKGVGGKLHPSEVEPVFDWLLDELDRNVTINWGSFDSDGDKVLDHVIVLHSGYTAELGSIPCHMEVRISRMVGAQ